ncbi:uncharacterized protein LOC102808375, partial [Saccoglossus kowalevskii]|uniref:Ankyrin-1-like n=1 Tax=Saccoglossus kowalevskii TaxID=10224 RepID=A0ABM0MXQ4_SACKO
RNQTPLHYAAKKGHHSTVEIPLKADVEKYPRDNKKRTPLHLAAIGIVSFRNYSPVLETLLKAGVSKEPRDEDGDTPLHLAVRNSKVNVVNSLLQYGVERDIQNLFSMTPLEIAIKKGNPRIIQLLSNADIPDSVFDEVQHIDDDNVFEFVKDIAAPDGKIDSKLQSKIMKDPHGDNNNAGSNQRSKVPHTKKKNKKKKADLWDVSCLFPELLVTNQYSQGFFKHEFV